MGTSDIKAFLLNKIAVTRSNREDKRVKKKLNLHEKKNTKLRKNIIINQ